jgi:uncharacterized protein DUF1375
MTVDRYPEQFYGGTRTDLALAQYGAECLVGHDSPELKTENAFVQFFFPQLAPDGRFYVVTRAFVDLPLSVIADTVMLPIPLWLYFTSRSAKESRSQGDEGNQDQTSEAIDP